MSTLIVAVPLRSQVPGSLRIRFSHELGRSESAEWRDFEAELEQLHGVERVHMGRYGAELTYATHITTSEYLSEAVWAMVQEWWQTWHGSLPFTDIRITTTIDDKR